MCHTIKDNIRFEAKLKIKIYNPDGTFEWKEINGEITNIESEIYVSQIFDYEHVTTIERTFTFVCNERYKNDIQ